MASFDEAAILGFGTTPLPGDNPCGTECAEEEHYLSAQAEVSKLGRVGVEEPSWLQLEQDCLGLLRERTRDVEIASWLALALFRRHGYAGLAAGLGLLDALLRNFWDQLHPARPRRRKARIEALAIPFVDGLWFREHTPKTHEFDSVDACVTRAQALVDAFNQRMPDEPLDFRKFLEGLKTAAAKRPKPDAPVPSAPSAAAGSAVPAEGAGAAPITDVSGATKALLAAATFLQKSDPTNPVSYGVVRVVKWSRVSLPPTAPVQAGAPEASLISALAAQHAAGDWTNLLSSAESVFRTAPLWLDLQRHAAAAMSALGPPYEKARQTVLGLTAALLRRLGDAVYSLNFRTGLPLCSGETRMWLESELGSVEGGSSSGSHAAGNGRLDEATSKARTLAGGGKLKEALRELQGGLATCTQRRERLLWRLRIAQLCSDAGRLQLAAPLLEECYEETRRYRLTEWEPTVAVDVAQALYKCRKALANSAKPPSPEAVERVRESFSWLCQLDPLMALAVEPA
jgi:type VI secretion system protein VasJ